MIYALRIILNVKRKKRQRSRRAERIGSIMSHKEFVEKYKTGKIIVSIHRSLSISLAGEGHLPKRYFLATNIWSLIVVLSILAGIVLLFIRIYIGILLLLFSFFGWRAIKQSAMEFVLEYALENENFYNFAVDNKIIVIRQNTPS